MTAEKQLRDGITTGTCAAAALRAALLLLRDGRLPEIVDVTTPQERKLSVPVAGGEILPDGDALAYIIKDAGDDPDITHGAAIKTRVRLTPRPGWTYEAGEGVGTATKAGLSVPVGAAAINPGPRKMMDKVLRELLPPGRGARVTVSVPGGRELAKKTLNAMLGIEGGISIIGTTGIVRPMSEEAFKSALIKQLDVLKAGGIKTPVLVPGKIGGNIAAGLGVADEHIVQISNFAGVMLRKTAAYGFSDILLLGHIGKLVKLSGGIFNTHSSVADGRQEIFAAHLAALGADTATVRAVLAATTTEAIAALVERAGLTEVYPLLAERAARRCAAYIKGRARVGVALAAMSGRLLGWSQVAEEMGREAGWRITKDTN
jgi:cobalt-precorrin-5B (C1)-methyltransferase